MMNILDNKARALLFEDARTHASWQDRPVTEEQLRELYDLMKFGPTSANSFPIRLVFAQSPEAKDKLKPCLAEGNIEKTMNAPVTAIIAMDIAFYEKLPTLFPHADARSWFVGNDPLIEETAFRNSSLQGAYLMIAARALGLDCGPMSGFDNDAVDAAFFADTTYRSNFLCNLGYGKPEDLYPRAPRPDFDDVCNLL